jgi:hypothetical protein
MTAVIMRLAIEEATWTAAGPYCRADAKVGGRVYSIRCRHASVELARQLVAAGIPDQEIEVRITGCCGRMDTSLYDLAAA